MPFRVINRDARETSAQIRETMHWTSCACALRDVHLQFESKRERDAEAASREEVDAGSMAKQRRDQPRRRWRDAARRRGPVRVKIP